MIARRGLRGVKLIISDAHEGIKAVGAAFRAEPGDHSPPITAIEVSKLMVDEAKIEIEALAVVPD